MDNLLEYLVPAVVFIIWVFGQYLEKRKQGREEEDNSYRPSQQEQEEQARRIQEEIRRKIAARRQQQQGPQPAPASPPPMARQSAPPPIQQSSPYSSPPLSERGRVQTPRHVSPPPMRSEPPVYVEAEPSRDIFAELAEQEKRMEETQRRADEARAQARRRISSSTREQRSYSRVPRVTGSLREDLLETFRDPMAARKAVLYYEVLGTPVGQRRQGQLRPSWES